MKKDESKTYNRKAIFAELKDYCYLSKEHSFIEVTEWKNGDGVDITIDSFQCTHFSLTYGEIDAIKKLTKKLNK